MPSQSFEAIVLGAGLFGAATAFYLAARGVRTVMIERGHVGAQSSGSNFGNLRLQGRSRLQYPLSLRAQSLWEDFERNYGGVCEYDQNGHVYFARDEDGRNRLLGYARNSREVGMEIEVLEGSALRQRFPILAEEVCIASYSPRCATANPRLATPVICQAFVRAGGHLRTECEITEIRKVGDGFELRSNSGETFMGERLVNSAGAWAGAIAGRFGETVPLFGAGPPQFVTEPLPYVLRPVLQAIEGDVILRQIQRGNFIFAGYPRTRANADGKFTFVPPIKLQNGMRMISRLMPAFAGIEMIRCWSGVEGYLPDMLPVVGASETVGNLFHAFGASGGGFQIGPAVGESLAALVVGDRPVCDLDLYRIGRFRNGTEVSEKIAKEFDS